MIEYMEECILRLIFSDQFLDIIQDQHIHTLIEIHEVVCRISPDSLRILYGKEMGRYIQHLLFRMDLLDAITDCVAQMGFSHTGCTVNKHRIIGLSRCLSYFLTGRTDQPVACSFKIIIEIVFGVQVRIPVLTGF